MGLATIPIKSDKGVGAQAVKPLVFRYGRSISGSNPSTDLSSQVPPISFRISLNGDTAQTVSLLNKEEMKTGTSIAIQITEAVRGLVASVPELYQAYREFRCEYQDGVYTLISGLAGDNSSVVITNAVTGNVADLLKLGIANGGTEDFFYPKETAYADHVQVSNDEQNPVPVKITEGNVTIDAGDLDVNLSHVGPDPDSVRIGDGTNEVAVNPDGSINVVTTGEASVTTPNIANVVCANANTEYFYTLPVNSSRYSIKARGNSRIQLSYETGMTNSQFITVCRGCTFLESNLKGDPALTIYFEVDKAGEVIEILSWS